MLMFTNGITFSSYIHALFYLLIILTTMVTSLFVNLLLNANKFH